MHTSSNVNKFENLKLVAYPWEEKEGLDSHFFKTWSLRFVQKCYKIVQKGRVWALPNICESLKNLVQYIFYPSTTANQYMPLLQKLSLALKIYTNVAFLVWFHL